MYLPGKKKQRWNLRVLAGTVLLSTGMILVPFQASADSISDWKQQYASLQKQLQQVQGQLDAQNSTLKTERSKLDAINKEVSLVQNQLAVLKQQVDSVNAQIKDKQDQVKATEQRISQNKVLLAQRLRAMYMSGNDTFLTVLLDSDNLGDFLSRVEMVRAVSSHDNQVIEDLKQDESKLKSDQKVLSDSKKSLLQVQGTAAAKQAILNGQLAQQRQAVKLAKSGSSSLQNQVDALDSQASQTDAQIEASITAQAQAAKAAASSSKSSSTYHLDASALGNATALVSYAEQFVGSPYSMGSAGPYRFDCSGLVMYVYANAAGISLPHSAAGQSFYGSYVSKGNLQPGDLVFFRVGGGSIDHVGIYVGGGEMVNAEKPGVGVVYDNINSGYWASKFAGGRRILG